MTHATPRLLTATLSAVALAATAGCGKDDKQALTKPQFVTKANAICKGVNTTLTREAGKVFTGAKPSDAVVRRYAQDTAYPQIQKEIDAIARLGAPKGDEATVKAILDAVRAGLAKVKADPVLLSASDSTAPFTDANAKARAYGLTVCAS